MVCSRLAALVYCWLLRGLESVMPTGFSHDGAQSLYMLWTVEVLMSDFMGKRGRRVAEKNRGTLRGENMNTNSNSQARTFKTWITLRII